MAWGVKSLKELTENVRIIGIEDVFIGKEKKSEIFLSCARLCDKACCKDKLENPPNIAGEGVRKSLTTFIWQWGHCLLPF